MNGEPLRPQQGFPVRIMVPGFEGIYHTKFLRRIKVADRFYMNYNEFGHLRPEDKELALGEQIGPKSVITYPSGTQRLPGPGFYEISGLAWSGGGAVKTVEVSTDGGKKWNRAEFKNTPQRMAHVRFAYPWKWDGTETEIHVALHRRDRAEAGAARGDRRLVESTLRAGLPGARAGQQRYALENRQGRERDQWAR